MNKKDILIIGPDVFFGKPGNAGYDGLSKFLNVIAISALNFFLHLEDDYVLYYNDGKGYKEFDLKPDLVISRSARFKYSEFGNLLVKILKDKYKQKIFQYKFLERYYGKIDVYKLLIDIGYSKRIIPSLSGYIDRQIGKQFLGEKIISKKSKSAQGRDVMDYKDFSKIDFENTDLYKKGGWIHQKCLINDSDVRILVLGDKILGGYTRKKIDKNKIVTNISAGGIAEKFDIPKWMEKEAIDITQKLGIEYCGIDYMYDNVTKKYYILEINSFPATSGIRDLYGFNPYEVISEYLYNKIT